MEFFENTRKNIVRACCFPGFNLRSCLDTPETDIVMFCIDGELSFLGSKAYIRRLGSFFFCGGVKILNFIIFLGFQKNDYF